MRKILFATLSLLFLGLFLIISTQTADAHFLAVDSNIGAVLHVDPNDEPIAGEQASFFFEFKDKQNKFQPANCDCTFSVVENGKEIFSQQLFQNSTNPSLTNVSVFYTFPQRDVYEVRVVGKPLTQNAFQSFTLKWNFRVDQQTNGQNTIPQTTNDFFTSRFLNVYFIGGGIIIIFFFIYITYNVRHRKKTTTKGGEKQDDKKDSRTMY